MKFYADIKELGESGLVASHLRCIGDDDGKDYQFGAEMQPPRHQEFYWGERVVVMFGIRTSMEAALEEMRLYIAKMFPEESSVLLEWPYSEAAMVREGIKPQTTKGLLFILSKIS